MTETLRGSTPQSEFDLTTTLDDDQECACEDCHDDVDDQLTLLLGCDARGMVADYGTVGFCSLEEDLIIYTQHPVVATVVHKGETIETTLSGHEVSQTSPRGGPSLIPCIRA